MITAYSIASKFIGQKEVAGALDNPLIMQWLRLDSQWPNHDEIPWCSAFVNWVCWLCDIQRTKSLLARSWLGIGKRLQLHNAVQGDIVILKRSGKDQPGSEDRTAPGHVGFYAFHHEQQVWVLGGNQHDSVSIDVFPIVRVLGVRRLE